MILIKAYFNPQSIVTGISVRSLLNLDNTPIVFDSDKQMVDTIAVIPQLLLLNMLFVSKKLIIQVLSQFL